MRILVLLSCFLLLFIYVPESFAQSCNGTYTCKRIDYYYNLNPPGCNPGSIFNPCNSYEIQWEYGSGPCSAHSLPGQCPAADINQVCFVEGFDGGAESVDCSAQPAPTTDPCGGGPRSYCGFGGGYYCCGTGMTCTGSPPNFGCSSGGVTPTPSCTYGSCSSAGATFPSSDPTGQYVCDGTCWQWQNFGPTSAPTSAPPGGGGSTPAPTSPPTCTPTSTTCNGGETCCSPQVCLSAGGPPEWCGDDPWAGGGGGGGPSCIATGGTCYEFASDGCCSGFCAGTSGWNPGTCTDIPTCTGCQSFNGFGCTDNNNLCPAGQVCTGGTCIVQTYTISGTIFIDTDQDGTRDAGESAIGANSMSGESIRVSPGSTTSIGGSSGSYTFTSLVNGTYSVVFTVPTGYIGTSTNPRSVNVSGSNVNNINFGIFASVPACVPGSIALNPSGGTANPGGNVTLSVTACTNVENPNDGTPPPPFNWNPDTGGNSPAPTTSGQTDTPTSSTITWTAPSCPSSQTTYTPRVTVGGAGGTTNYSTSITVPATVGVTTHVRSVTSVGSCNSTSGSAYNNGGAGANVNINGGGGTVNRNQTTNPVSGSTAFTCLPQGNYTTTLQVPSGYSVIGTDVSPAVESPVGSNGLSFATGTNSQTVTFCIAPIDPWFQTDLGDVRFVNLSNPVPTGQYGSSDATYPGIFYSSDSSANFGNAGNASSSVRQWVINNEYSYNADTENRNGGMSYDFYKSKALKDGVVVTQLTTGVFDEQQITDTGVYEANGNLTINSYNHTPGRRVVILVNGNVTINSEIDIPVGTGLFIVAAKGNITIDDTVGTTTITSSTSNLDGYYTAQGSIILESVGNGCADGVTSDRRLNVAGALVANSLKPFSSTGTGTVQNNRSLCLDNLTRPSLFIASRPDFLVQLTDFYKTSYTKWREVNP